MCDVSYEKNRLTDARNGAQMNVNMYVDALLYRLLSD